MFRHPFTQLRAPKEHDDSNEGSGDASSTATASPEPTDADLLQILGTGNPPAKPARKAKPAPAAEPDDEDLDDAGDGEQDDDGGDGDESPKPRSQAGEADGAEGDDQGGEGEGSEDDGSDGADAGDANPDTDLDAEDKQVRGSFTKEQQARFDKAVSKKTRRILELKTELADEQAERERLAAELETARKTPAAAAAPTADNPLADIDDEATLDKRLTDARKLRRFALQNADGAYVDTKTGALVDVEEGADLPAGVVHFSKRRIGEILAETEETLQEHGPKHRAFLQQRAQAEAQAVQVFPFLKDKKTAGYQTVEATLREAPALRTIPGIKMLLADAFLGRHWRLSQQQAKAKPGAKPGADATRKAPPSPGRGAPPARIAGKHKVAGDALKHVAQTGDDPDNAGLRAILQN